MPELNPLSNEQIFLKKIAENTGSDYNTGDVSEINPITIDQILLKEIAANTAGQSGDITELEEKVADNTSAIEAIVNVNGCCNIAPTFTSTTVNGRTFTVSSDGTITVTGAGDGTDVYHSVNLPKLNENCQYILNGCPLGGDVNKYALSYSNSIDGSHDDYGSGIKFTPYDYSLYPNQKLVIYINGSYSIQTPLVFKPMLYDARLNPTGYVPYAMTNEQLTERVIKYRVVDISNIAITALDNGVYYSDLISIGQVDHVHIMSVSQVSPWWSNLGFVIVNGCGVALTSAVSWTTPSNTYMKVYYYET